MVEFNLLEMEKTSCTDESMENRVKLTVNVRRC